MTDKIIQECITKIQERLITLFGDSQVILTSIETSTDGRTNLIKIERKDTQ